MEAQELDHALREAMVWLDLADRGHYDIGWTRASLRFRTAVTQPDWAERMRETRSSIGTIRGRKLQSLAWTRRLPDLPDGQYAVVVHDCNCSQETGPVSETLSLERETDGSYRVLGYFIGARAQSKDTPEA